MKLNMFMFILFVSMFSLPSVSRSDNTNDYQLRRLLNPSAAEYSAESKGSVYIYDGLDSTSVDLALDNHFDRIDGMMFTRIVYTNDLGEQYVEEDGCD
jgi:hypothetical protein